MTAYRSPSWTSSSWDSSSFDSTCSVSPSPTTRSRRPTGRAARPVLGVVHVPVSGVSYVGAGAQGAWKIEADGSSRRVHVRAKRAEKIQVAGSRSHAGDSLLRFLDRIGDHDIVSMGSSLKLCLVAEGKADIYPRLGPTSEWDTAAAQAVVEAAGGMVTDTQMQPLRYNTKESLLNPHFLVFGDRSENWGRFV